MNPYLTKRRADYDALRAGIEAVQNRAAQENRDLTEQELASVRSQGEQAQALAAEITDLTEIQARHEAVAATAAQVNSGTETRSDAPGAVRVSGTTAQDRDPGHYRSVQDGGTHSFFADVVRFRTHQDSDALRRLTEHNRALNSTDQGPGVLPPVWMTSEFTELARQQRRVASAVRRLPITDPRPISMPRQSADASGVAAQTAENDTTTFGSSWDSTVDTVQVATLVGGEELSRQLLDSSSPAIDALVWGNLVALYNSQVEARVVAAMIASAGAAVKTYATEAAYATALDPTDANYVGDAILDAAIAVRNARKLPADVVAASVTRYGSLLKIKDTTGRPLIPSDSGGAMNVIGVGDVAIDGRVHGLGVLASDGVTQYPESIVVARGSDTILFESPTVRFRYDEPKGPETIRLGVWGYCGVYVQHAGKSAKRIAITAAA